MEKQVTLVINKEKAEEIENVLNKAADIIEKALVNGTDQSDIGDLFKEIEEEFSVTFDDGTIVNISVCSGNPPYVDATLIANGVSVDCEPGETLLGEYYFQANG
jgi:hypothetical protein